MDFEMASAGNAHSRSDIAWACTVYSLVPYLGILFVPFALIVACFGYVRSRQRSSNDGGRFILCLGLSSFILSVQLLLWWLLYFIPKIGI